jgi:anthranilate phosphoribosyltransferase
MARIDDTLREALAGEPLTFAEAEAAMAEIMAGEVSPVKLAAWLTALRMKGETAAEIGGCAAAMAAQATRIACDDPRAVDIVGTGGDGTGTHNLSTAAALVAAGAGLTVAKHGNRAVSSRSGSADVLAALGVRIDLTPEDMAACLRETGIAFLFAPSLHPAMRHAMPVRRELGIRTIFNVLGPLTNPAGVRRMVIGVYTPALCPVIAAACREIGKEHVMVVHGGGMDELTPAAPAAVCELRNHELREYTLDPVDLGIPRCRHEDLRGGTPADNAAMIHRILAGREHGPVRDAACLGAAAALIVAGKTEDWAAALAMAAAAIDGGHAAAKLAAMVAFSSTRE